MKKKFYICGTRPVIREIHNDYEEYFSFQWETGQFKQDMQYMENIYFDSPAAARLYRVAFVTNLLKSFYLYKNIKDEQKLQIS